VSISIKYDYGSYGHWYEFSGVIEDFQSPFQRVRVLTHSRFGKCLVLDDDLMSSEAQNGEYDDTMLSLVPEASKPTCRVLILGGGDGSLARRLAAEPWVESIVVVELDKAVTDVCLKHFDSRPFSDKITFRYENALDYLKEPRTFDVVFNDLLDVPLGVDGNFYDIITAQVAGAVFICQTGSYNRDSHKHARELIGNVADVKTESVFIPDFMEHWTFTRFSKWVHPGFSY
jgi:spermidine synthase